MEVRRDGHDLLSDRGPRRGVAPVGPGKASRQEAGERRQCLVSVTGDSELPDAPRQCDQRPGATGPAWDMGHGTWAMRAQSRAQVRMT
jgi:hypothetical protein